MTASITGQDNPYIIGVPIHKPESFFGREDLFLFIKDNLKQNAKVILLHGQRRIGKSSVLLQVHNFVQLERFLFVFLSLEGKSRKSVSDVLYEIASEILEYLEDEFELEVDGVRIPSKKDLQKEQELFSEVFLRQVFEVIDGKNLVLLLDEFDVLGEHSEDTASTHLFPYLKSLVDEQEQLFIIPVVGRRLDDMPNLLGLFHEAPNLRIGLLSERNAERLITEPAQGVLEYQPDAIQGIIELSAGHPYFTQIICFALFSKAREEGRSLVTREDVESIVDKALENAEAGLAWFYDGLPIPERVVFSAVAQAQQMATGKAEFFVEDPLTVLRKYGVIQTKSLIQAGERLTKWGFVDLLEVLEPPKKVSAYKVKIELVRRWLLKRHPLKQEIRELWESRIPKIVNYFGLREDFKLETVESADTSVDENLPCPYQGFHNFGPNEAEFFFGREVFVEELFNATRISNFITLLGASGSGKSSVVLAGLVPKLQQEGNWLFTYFCPGANPFLALAEALIPLFRTELGGTEQIIQAKQLAQSVAIGSLLLKDVFGQIKKNYPNYRVLVIADQFEELYNLCSDESTPHQFLDTLLNPFHSGENSASPIVLVATLRADFFGNALSYPPLADILRKGVLLLSSMNLEEVRAVIEKPAKNLGVSFEYGLVQRILNDVQQEPGNLPLPLLEFALTELWQKRTQNQLTHSAYENIGEISGVLTRYVDEKYHQLSKHEKERVRRIFVQLVLPGEGTEDTRRIATKEELQESDWYLVKKLADDRLVVTNRSFVAAQEQETVEVIHEALIRNWDQLRQWMETDREFRIWQERLRIAVRLWQETGREKEALLRGVLLAEAEDLLQERPEKLNLLEQEFIELSIEWRKRQKLEKQRKKSTIPSILIFLLTLLVSITVPITIWFQIQRSQIAEIRARSASGEALFASNSQLEGLIASLRSGKELKLLPRNNTELNNEVIETLQKVVDEIKEQNRFQGNQGSVTSVNFSPDGKLLVSVGENGTVNLWNLEGKLLRSLIGNQGSITSLTVTRYGSLLASAGTNGTVDLRTWEGKLLYSFRGNQGSATSITFSPDGNLLASAGENGTVNLWNLEGKLLYSFGRNQGSVTSVAFSPDGKLLASAGENGMVKLWNLEGKLLRSFIGSQGLVTSISFSPDGRLLAIGRKKGTVYLWNLQGVQEQVFNVPKGAVNSVRFSPDGKLLATAGADGTARLWDLRSRQQSEKFQVPEGAINTISFSPDGKLLATGGEDGTIRLWNLQKQQPPKSTENQNLDELLERGCNWVRDYLENNPEVDESDKTLCNDIIDN
ncbi:MAG: AAA family ATPase [Okeania sp. SIO3H1]|nr:AAA family ATPase [Okeania sp. SIO3H1]